MKLEDYIDYLIEFLKKQLEVSNTSGYVLGISGGIDSALVAAILKKGNINCLGVLMPCHSNPADLEDGILLCKYLNLNYVIKDLSLPYDVLLDVNFNKDAKDGVKANIKARLRMTTLYALGQTNNYLVLGTDNKAEWHTGFFTKYGDGGVDVAPIVYLTKTEVRQASTMLNVPQKIIDRVPTPGLIANKTDEDELLVTYNELDAYLDGLQISQKAKDRIEYLHKISEHKRNMPIKPKEFVK